MDEKNQAREETKISEFQNKFIAAKEKISKTGHLFSRGMEGISQIFNQALKYVSNFTASIKTYFEEKKDNGEGDPAP